MSDEGDFGPRKDTKRHEIKKVLGAERRACPLIARMNFVFFLISWFMRILLSFFSRIYLSLCNESDYGMTFFLRA